MGRLLFSVEGLGALGEATERLLKATVSVQGVASTFVMHSLTQTTWLAGRRVPPASGESLRLESSCGDDQT